MYVQQEITSFPSQLGQYMCEHTQEVRVVGEGESKQRDRLTLRTDLFN